MCVCVCVCVCVWQVNFSFFNHQFFVLLIIQYLYCLLPHCYQRKLMVEERPIIFSLRVCHVGSVLVLVVKVAWQTCSYFFQKSSILYPGYQFSYPSFFSLLPLPTKHSSHSFSFLFSTPLLSFSVCLVEGVEKYRD